MATENKSPDALTMRAVMTTSFPPNGSPQALSEHCNEHNVPMQQRPSPSGRRIETFCPKCEEQAQRDRLRRTRQQRQRELRERIEAVIPPRYRCARRCHISRALRDAISRAPADTGFVLYGPTGRGKTYALMAYARTIIMGGHWVAFVTWDELIDDVRTSCHGGPSERSTLQKYTMPSHLIIDDLATAPLDQEETAYKVRILTMILERRIKDCLPTYFATNKTKAEIERSFDGRVASRFELFDWIGVGGKDKRRRQP